MKNNIFPNCALKVVVFLFIFIGSTATQVNAQTFDLVIKSGRVIDPETKTDKVLNVGINGGTIAAISADELSGKKTINAQGLIVAPGAIDIHHHSPFLYGVNNSTRDGVTTVVELEAGSFPVSSYGTKIEGKSPINFGASVSHIMARIQIIEGKKLGYYELGDQTTPGWHQKATSDQVIQLKALLNEGIDKGGIGIGLLLDYVTDAVTDEELEMVFSVASRRNVPIFIHVRRYVNGDIKGLTEVLEWTKKTNASAHICHINANAMGNYKAWLEQITLANKNGGNISTELFPYTAGSTGITADVFGRDWQKIFNITPQDVQWGETGEYFKSLEQFNEYRKKYPRGTTIHHYMKEAWIKEELKYPGIILSTDAMPSWSPEAKAVPNGIGSFTKVLARYVRDDKSISLMKAIAMSSYLPAKRLQPAAPSFAKKGRVQLGADADLRIFDLSMLETKASFEKPYQPSTGYRYILVNGEFVVQNDQLSASTPGKRILGTPAQ